MASEQSTKKALEGITNFLESLRNDGEITNFNFTYEFPKAPKTESKFIPILKTLCLTLTNIKEEKLVSNQNESFQGIENKSDYNSSDPKLVQICVSRKEINRRIEAFIKRKRKEVDDLNTQEFCGRPPIDETNPDYDNFNTCARVDAIYFPHYGGKSHLKISRVENIWGPQTKPKTNLNSDNSVEQTDSFSRQLLNNGIEERLRNMESHLKLKSDIGTTSITKDYYTRLKTLEDKILFLEGISPDYFGSSIGKMVSSKGKPQNEIETKYKNWSVQDIDSRMEQLTQIIKNKKSS